MHKQRYQQCRGLVRIVLIRRAIWVPTLIVSNAFVLTIQSRVFEKYPVNYGFNEGPGFLFSLLNILDKGLNLLWLQHVGLLKEAKQPIRSSHDGFRHSAFLACLIIKISGKFIVILKRLGTHATPQC